MKINAHIIDGKESLLNQLQARITALKRLVNVVDFSFSLNLANGLFISKLLYGIQIWGLAPKYLLQKLQVLMNKAAIVVLGNKAYKMSTIELLNEVNWLSIDKLITIHISIMVHTIINTKEPEYLYKRIVRESTNTRRNNIGRKLGQNPDQEGRSQYTKDQFCSRVYSIYNELPAQIASITDRSKFKKHIKMFIKTGLLPNAKDYPIFGLSNGL